MITWISLSICHTKRTCSCLPDACHRASENQLGATNKGEKIMKLFILAVIVVTVLLGSALMHAANKVTSQYNAALTNAMKDLK